MITLVKDRRLQAAVVAVLAVTFLGAVIPAVPILLRAVMYGGRVLVRERQAVVTVDGLPSEILVFRTLSGPREFALVGSTLSPLPRPVLNFRPGTQQFLLPPFSPRDQHFLARAFLIQSELGASGVVPGKAEWLPHLRYEAGVLTFEGATRAQASKTPLVRITGV